MALLMTGALTVFSGAWWFAHYPDDFNDNLIISPEKEMLALAMLVGVVFLAAGVFVNTRTAYSMRDLGIPSRFYLKLPAAGLIVAIYVAMPFAASQRKPLPYCAFNKEGVQLSICLDKEDQRVIVD